MSSGGLRDRLMFQARGLDANGDPLGEFEDRLEAWAKLDYQRGSEAAVSNRLEGRQPVSIDIRDSSSARQITPGWCAVKRGGLRNGEVFNITAVAPGRVLGMLNVLAYSGKAPG